MSSSSDPLDQALAIINDQLALEAHQRRRDKTREEIARARLEAYTAVVKALTGHQLADDAHLW